MLFSNINEDEFEQLREFSKDGVLYYEVRLKNRGAICKGCGTFHKTIKEYRLKKIIHSIYAYQKCVILFRQRRFICPKCKSTQMEDNPFRSSTAKVSDQTIRNVLQDLKRYNNTFHSVAERYHMSARGVMKIFDRYCQIDRLTLPRVFCADEIYFSRKRHKKYILVLLNFFNGAIIDVLKDRDKHTIAVYLSRIPRKERDRVEFVSIDMNDHYRDVFSIYLHNAIIVVDSFHVLKRVNRALDEIRLKVMHRFDTDKKSDEYYLLKYRDSLLYKKELRYDRTPNRHYHRYISENEMLGYMLDIDSELDKAYSLYHRYVYFNGNDYSSDICAAENELNMIISDYKLSGMKPFIDLADTLEYWKKEIVSSFLIVDKRRVSNGPIEGRNSLMKKILHLANGYDSFQRFRNRVMYSLNRFSKHSFDN